MEPYKPLGEIPDEEKAILAQIKTRRELVKQMVGWLYPRILRDEIIELRSRLVKFPLG